MNLGMLLTTPPPSPVIWGIREKKNRKRINVKVKSTEDNIIHFPFLRHWKLGKRNTISGIYIYYIIIRFFLTIFLTNIPIKCGKKMSFVDKRTKLFCDEKELDFVKRKNRFSIQSQ